MTEKSAKEKAIRYIVEWHLRTTDRHKNALTEKNLVGERICESENDAIILIYELVGEGLIEFKPLYHPYNEIIALPKCFAWEQGKKKKRQQTLLIWLPIIVSILMLLSNIIAILSR